MASANDDVLTEQELLALPPSEFGSETRRRALAAYTERDWYGIYGWTKAWISSGGGAWVVDSWLLYVISSLLHGQPRTAVRCLDIALRTWIEAPEDRAILHWVRAAVIHRWLNDPKTARADYDAARQAAPGWLREQADADLVACAADAASSRKRKPSVAPAPALEPMERGFVSGPVATHRSGAVPGVWSELVATLDERR